VEELRQRLTAHAVIGLDTAVFVYHVEARPRYLPATRAALDTVEAGQVEAVTSVITIMELTVHPWRVSAAAVARQYEALLVHFPHLRVEPVTRDIARRAAQLRAGRNLRPADALQVATALHHGATAFVTNDKGLTRLSGLLDVVLLEEFV
jgi:predicted nucleic acid-binding protein